MYSIWLMIARFWFGAPGFWRIWWRAGAPIPFILGTLTVMVSLSSFGQLRDGLVFDAEGVVTQAQVVDHRTQVVKDDEGKDTDYYVTMQFVARDGPISVEREVARDFFQEHPIGAVRDVRFLPGAPHKVEFVIGQTWQRGQTSRWLALVLGVLSLGSLWYTARSAIDGLLARRFGRAMNARVLEIQRFYHDEDGVSYSLRFVGDNGVFGNSLSRDCESAFASFPPGTTIEVFRGAKGRLWWVGDVGPRATARTVPDASKPRT
ncbi:MAG: DUF3592 domain-containing protein [Pseudomonadota bacterium]